MLTSRSLNFYLPKWLLGNRMQRDWAPTASRSAALVSWNFIFKISTAKNRLRITLRLAHGFHPTTEQRGSHKQALEGIFRVPGLWKRRKRGVKFLLKILSLSWSVLVFLSVCFRFCLNVFLKFSMQKRISVHLQCLSTYSNTSGFVLAVWKLPADFLIWLKYIVICDLIQTSSTFSRMLICLPRFFSSLKK